MADYVKVTDFSVKDTLPSGNPSKVVRGTEIDSELVAVQAAITTKVNNTGNETIAGIKTFTSPIIGGTTTQVSKTSDTGSATVPVGTTGQRDVSPQAGYFRFNSSLNKFEGYTGTLWGSVGGGATGGDNDEVFIENSQTVTASYTLTAGKNAMSTGPITINNGVSVTIPSGARWVIL